MPAPAMSASPRLPAHYGPVELAKSECVKVEGSVLRGTDCPSGIAVFGPYATVAAGADVSYSFSIRPSADADIAVDLVADSGKIILAELGSTLKKDQPSWLLLRARSQGDMKALQARIAVVSTKKLSYAITDISLDVH